MGLPKRILIKICSTQPYQWAVRKVGMAKSKWVKFDRTAARSNSNDANRGAALRARKW